MSATITSNAGGIKRSGVTVENEPIIKSDGAGEVMQWQPSDGAADGIFIKEVSAGDKLRVGVGVDLSAWAGGTAIQLGAAGHIVSADPWLYVGSNYYYQSGWKYTTDAAATRYTHGAGTHTFSVSNNTPAVNGAITWTDALTISSAGNVGVGISPSANQALAYGPSLQVGLAASLIGASAGNNLFLSNNALFDNSNWLLTNGGQAGQLFINTDGSFTFRQERSAGSAGGTISWDNALTISSAGAVNIPGAFTAGSLTVGSLDIGHGAGGATCTAVGTDALDNSHAGALHNTAIGSNALTGTHTAATDNNTAVGSDAGKGITSGSKNTAVGTYALDATDDGVGNTSLGYATLGENCEDDNTAVGNVALNAFTGSNATAVGSGAADAATTALYLTAVGKDALGACTTGGDNTAVGLNSSLKATTGNNNTTVGVSAGQENLTGTNNTFMGSVAGAFTSINDHCVGIGRSALAGVAGSAVLSCVKNGSTTITCPTSAVIAVGQHVRGVGIPDGSTVTTVNVAGAVTLFAIYPSAATDSDTSTLTFYTNVGDYNVAVGNYALDATTTGTRNIGIGHNAGGAFTDNTDSIAIGHQALAAANTGEHSNIAIGSYALTAETSGADGCVAIGHNALAAQNTEASNNTAIGFQAALNLNGGTDSVYMGYLAGGAGEITGDNNVAIGKGSLANATSAANSVYVGFTAGGLGVATGDGNVVVGSGAGYDLTSGASNVLIGRDAGANSKLDSNNVVIGQNAMDADVADAGYSRTHNIAIGTDALGGDTAGCDYCVAIGSGALAAQNADVKNTAIGGLAGDSITGGGGNTLVGYQTGAAIVGGGNNTAVGHEAYYGGTGSNNTMVGSYTGQTATGNDNVCVGSSAGLVLGNGPGNVLIGRAAGVAMNTGDYNVAIGYQAADGLAGDADYNIAIGSNALGGCTAATSSNIAIGTSALEHASYAAANINLAIGQSAGIAITTGTYNVLIGHEAGSAIATTDASTAVGYNALKDATGAGNTAIGYFAATNVVAGAANTAVGDSALWTANGGEGNNTAIGAASFYNLDDDDADDNVALGMNAGRWDSAGTTDGTTASPADGLVKAKQCTYLGAGARASHNGIGVGAIVTNEIVIGYGTVGVGSNSIAFGNTSIGNIDGQVAFGTYSDKRIKRDIVNDDTGLTLIEKLQPVTYKNVNPADYPEAISEARFKEGTNQELVTPAVEAAEAVYEDVIVQEARDAVAEETRDEVHPAVEEVTEEVTIPAVEAVYEDRVTVHAEAERTETRITQEAREEITSTRHKHSEVEVTETVTGEEIVEVDGKWVKRATSEEVTRTERTPLYEDCDLYDEDGSICTHCVTPAVEAVAAVAGVDAVEAVEAVAATYYEEGDELPEGVSVGDEKTAAIEAVEAVAYVEAVEAVEAVAEVRANDVHRVPVMEEYISQTAQEEVTETIVTPAIEEVTERVCVREAEAERTETRVVVEAADEWTETHVTRPAEAAVEEVTERRLVSAAVEAKDAVYETVTVPADDRPADDDTVRLGLIAQDVQTAMTEAGVEFDIVNESPNGKLSLKYGNLVMPLIKAVQELSARVKTLEG